MPDLAKSALSAAQLQALRRLLGEMAKLAADAEVQAAADPALASRMRATREALDDELLWLDIHLRGSVTTTEPAFQPKSNDPRG